MFLLTIAAVGERRNNSQTAAPQWQSLGWFCPVGWACRFSQQGFNHSSTSLPHMADQLDCALDLMRRMPPANIEDNLAGLIDLVPELTEQLLSAVDQPLKIAHDPASKKDYLLCDYNRDGDSYRFCFNRAFFSKLNNIRHNYRSPWSNKYDPPIDGGATPSAELRKMEVQANEVFDIYREL